MEWKKVSRILWDNSMPKLRPSIHTDISYWSSALPVDNTQNGVGSSPSPLAVPIGMQARPTNLKGLLSPDCIFEFRLVQGEYEKWGLVYHKRLLDLPQHFPLTREDFLPNVDLTIPQIILIKQLDIRWQTISLYFSGGGIFGRKAHTYPYATSTLRQQYPILPPSIDVQPIGTTSSRKKISFSIKTPSSCCEGLLRKKYHIHM